MLERPPSVDALARSGRHHGLPHALLVDVARAAIRDGAVEQFDLRAVELARTLLQPVINGTGVLLHTNLGRAPLGHESPATYSNLELDLTEGRRGSRSEHAAHLLARACGADAALVVNNGAAALLLVLAALAPAQGVAISRGELVEIGGGFRIPEVILQSGAQLIEVGTTNRTRIEDYARVAGRASVNLRVHRSNFQISGFVEEPSLTELGALDLPLVVDQGSGLLDSGCPWLPDGPPSWLRGELGARQILAAGASVVTFSGDKLLGGPQAGVIAGDAAVIAACSSHPLYRALRPGRLTLGALQEVAVRYLSGDAASLPFWRMATVPVDALRARAQALGVGQVIDCSSVPGGGSVPGAVIPSAGVALEGDHASSLRRARPRPLISRVVDDRTVVDLRTVDESDDANVGRALRDALAIAGP